MDYCLRSTYYYNQSGLINTEKVWLYDNAAVDLNNKSIVWADAEGLIKLSDNKFIALSDKIAIRPILNYSEQIPPSIVAGKLIESYWNGYSHSCSPFLLVALAVMSIYRTTIINISGGFPIVFLYGLSGGGKSNALKLPAFICGFDQSFIRSGSSTVRAIWNVLKTHKNIPVLFDEMIKQRDTDELEGLIKSTYDGTLRDKMLDGVHHNIQQINSTLMISSNLLPPEKEEIFNRLMFTIFDPSDFKVDIVKEFNDIRDTYLSSILPEILYYGSDNVEVLYNKYFEYLKANSSESNPRLIGNVAVAFTGIDLLFKIADMEIYPELIQGVVQYLNDYSQMVKHETVFDKFLSLLPLIVDRDLIGLDDYLEVRTESGRKILKIRSRELYNRFTVHLKNENTVIPSYSEFLNAAKVDPRVIMINNKPGSIRINNKSVKGFEVDITNDEDLHLLERVIPGQIGHTKEQNKIEDNI